MRIFRETDSPIEVFRDLFNNYRVETKGYPSTTATKLHSHLKRERKEMRQSVRLAFRDALGWGNIKKRDNPLSKQLTGLLKNVIQRGIADMGPSTGIADQRGYEWADIIVLTKRGELSLRRDILPAIKRGDVASRRWEILKTFFE